jgi:hypothetical protein
MLYEGRFKSSIVAYRKLLDFELEEETINEIRLAGVQSREWSSEGNC